MNGIRKGMAYLMLAFCLGMTASAFAATTANTPFYARYCNHGLEKASDRANENAHGGRIPC